jgi:hypothetical protein
MLEPVRNLWVSGLLVLGAILVSVAILAFLHQLAPSLRHRVIAVLTFFAGLYFPLEFFIPYHNFLTPWRNSVADFLRLMAAFTFGLGIINLLIIHGRHLLRWTSNAPFSLAFFSGFLLMLVIGLISHYKPTLWAQAVPKEAIGTVGFWDAAFRLFFEGALQSLNATIFALLAFFIVSAAYRAFRIRTLEAGLLMATAIVVMLANVPIGQQWLTGWIPEQSSLAWLRLEKLSHWLQTQVNAPTMRAIVFGLWVGSLAMAVRIILSLERTFTVGGQ